MTEVEQFLERSARMRAFEEDYRRANPGRVEAIPLVVDMLANPLPRLMTRIHVNVTTDFECGCSRKHRFNAGDGEVRCPCGTRHVKGKKRA